MPRNLIFIDLWGMGPWMIASSAASRTEDTQTVENLGTQGTLSGVP